MPASLFLKSRFNHLGGGFIARPRPTISLFPGFQELLLLSIRISGGHTCRCLGEASLGLLKYSSGPSLSSNPRSRESVTATSAMDDNYPRKRRKTSISEDDLFGEASSLRSSRDAGCASNPKSSNIRESLRKSISPPPPKNPALKSASHAHDSNPINEAQIISSPIQLSKVEGLPHRVNVDAVSLKDIVGHPLVKECWAFNYLIDVDFLM